MDFTAFSHGQIQSKQWLCQTLEPYIRENSRILILGSWYNVLAFMLCNRNSKSYDSITGIDKDTQAIEIANKICESWMIYPTPYIRNIVADANNFDMNGYDVIINCSCEHMESNEWFSKIPKNAVVCLQSTDVPKEKKGWDIVNPNPTLESFVSKYPLSNLFYKNEMIFDYHDLVYKRFMIIGNF